ncbi:hypothetical protein CVT27_17920 [Streptomyces cavourensis]|nr:hypothetical protein CVT27_17920 [Streptomyces cavourensis]
MVFLASALGVAAQSVAVAYLVLVDGVGSDDLVDLAALLSMASLFAWFFVRVGIQPLIVVETRLSCTTLSSPIRHLFRRPSSWRGAGSSPCAWKASAMSGLGFSAAPCSTETEPGPPDVSAES